ncbi:hypothetical protein ACFLS1_04455 [Verrucomicrobiota bacterium]
METRKYIFGVIVLCVALSVFANEPIEIFFHFDNTPLSLVCDHYTHITGKRVEVVRGVDASITVKSNKAATLQEYTELVEAKLKEVNVGLFPISTNRLVAAWINPPIIKSKSRKISYSELRERRLEAMRQRRVEQPASKLKGEELDQHLRKYNLQLIRKGEAPALPIQLTPEEDAQLVKEGVLPPVDGGPVGVIRNKKTNEVQQVTQPGK